MAFTFKRKKSVRKTVRRMARKRIGKALRHLDRCEDLEAVHAVRKDIKRLRALLRLVRRGIPKAEYRRYSRCLREAAAELAPARDSHVKVKALQNLISHYKQELAPRSLTKIKTALSASCRKEEAGLAQRQVPKKVGRLLRALARDPACFDIKTTGWSAIGPGLKRSYKEGRRCGEQARKNPAPENFHEWRKRVKDLLYQVGMLCPVWPEQLGAVEAELDKLSESLGDDHDLVLLLDPAVLKDFDETAEEEVRILKALISSRQRELRADALALGARFYQEKPSAFCKRLGQYWRKWRREAKVKEVPV